MAEEPIPIDDDASQVAIQIESHGDAVVVDVRGDLDLVTAPDLNDALATATDENGAAIVVDLSKVDFIDSSGLSVLVNLNRSTTRAGRMLALVSAKPRVQNTFAITGLTSVLPFHDDRAAALAAVRR